MAERGKVTQLPGDHSAQTHIELVANGTSDEVAIWVNDTDANVEITEAAYTPDAAVTGDDTNNFTLQVKNKGTDGTGTTGVTDIKTYNVASGGIAAFDKNSLVLSSTAANLLVAPGEVLSLDKAENGSGDTMEQGVFNLTYKFT